MLEAYPEVAGLFSKPYQRVTKNIALYCPGSYLENKVKMLNIKPKLNNNAFIIDGVDNHYLFFPFNRTFSVLNLDMLHLLQLCDGIRSIRDILNEYELPSDVSSLFQTLLDRKILVDSSHNKIIAADTSKEKEAEFGWRLTIFPSTACNLKCKYCYANGGDSPQLMSKKLYQFAIDYFIKSLPKEPSKYVNLSIHGGGEPTLNFELLKDISDCFSNKSKESGFLPKISITSNGTYKKYVHDWLIDNNIGISFSLDGPPEIQNFQRPFRSGSASFDIVIANIRRMVDSRRQIGIRATVSSYSLDTMQETVKLAISEGINAVHFEPLFQTERSVKHMISPPDPKQFSINFLECFLKGLEYDIDVSYSGLRSIDFPQSRFCSACGHNFCVTTDGFITSCYEVLNLDDPASKCFFIGKINVKKEEIKLYPEKIRHLRSRTSDNLVKCKHCFLRYNCAGDCPIKSFRASDGDMFGKSNERCFLAKEINKQIICWIADGYIQPRNDDLGNIYSFSCGDIK